MLIESSPRIRYLSLTLLLYLLYTDIWDRIAQEIFQILLYSCAHYEISYFKHGME